MTSQAALQKAKLQRDAAQFALDCTKSEYADLADTFKSLDSKAQGTVTLAGILVAAPFAFLKEVPAMSCALQWLVSGTLLASLGTIGCVLLALRVAEVAMPLKGSEAARLAADASRDDLPEDEAEAVRDDLMSAFYNDVQRTWSQAVDDLRANTLRKAEWVRRAQLLAATSAALAAVAVFVRIWN